MLGTVELEVLAELERGDTVTDLASKLEHSESYVSRAVSDLEERSLVYTERDGRWKHVVPSDARAVVLYRDFVRQHAHVDAAELLTPATIEVLYHFEEPSTVAELAERSDNYRNTVDRILKRLQHRGLVGKDGSRYSFNADFDHLHEFARELVHHVHRRRLDSVAPRGTILWETDDEFLAQTERAIDAANFLETGLPRFAEYGLQFLVTRHRYYFYTEQQDDLSPADVCCHTLLVDDDRRHRSYCLLLLAAVEVDGAGLRTKASKYGLEATVDALVEYLETDGDVRGEKLPDWTDFQELADEYGVCL